MSRAPWSLEVLPPLSELAIAPDRAPFEEEDEPEILTAKEADEEEPSLQLGAAAPLPEPPRWRVRLRLPLFWH